MVNFVLGCLNLFCAGMSLANAILGHSGAWHKILVMLLNILVALGFFARCFAV